MTELIFNNNHHHQSLLVPYNKKVYDSDRKIITKKTSKMFEKTNNHIKEILHNIEKLKPNTYKKYQISGYHEYKLLEHELKQISHIKYKLVEDKLLQRNKVNKIIGSYSDGCCFNCDGTIKYEHIKTSVLYIQINK